MSNLPSTAPAARRARSRPTETRSETRNSKTFMLACGCCDVILNVGLDESGRTERGRHADERRRRPAQNTRFKKPLSTFRRRLSAGVADLVGSHHRERLAFGGRRRRSGARNPSVRGRTLQIAQRNHVQQGEHRFARPDSTPTDWTDFATETRKENEDELVGPSEGRRRDVFYWKAVYVWLCAGCPCWLLTDGCRIRPLSTYPRRST
jgi:hypothetical protein